MEKFSGIIVIILMILVLILGSVIFINVMDFSDKNNEQLSNNNVVSSSVSNRKIIVSNNIKNNINIENTQNNILNENTTPQEINNQENNNYSLIPLNLGITEDVSGGEFIYVNDYKLTVNQELIDKGYNLDITDNVLTITSNDNTYKCIMIQISDNYVMPTEQEIDAFYQLDEYIEWDNEEYDYDDETAYDLHWEKYDKIYTDYYKSLGYTAKNCPDFVLTEEEENEIIGKYLLEGESKSSGSNGMFPGYQHYKYYDWGRMTRYTIPKYYYDETFGEDTSEFSACIYFFEYYDENERSYIDLWTV